ncbi:hypothetical protein M422DRAFT_41386 [Sphaerobolus stellatus SS14]|nr:hypothetical protein M422DRAFT_41386 [Sphaerobolus stellatus SS14]
MSTTASHRSTSQLAEALKQFRANSDSENAIACSKLNEISGKLARDGELRRVLPGQCPSLWTELSYDWTYLRERFPDDVGYEAVLCLARFTRNVVAGVPENQAMFFKNEDCIRGVLFSLSSHFQFEDADSFTATRMTVQCLSNTVTLNEELASKLWEKYVSLPEERDILSRLLTSPDIPTVKATLILILNSATSTRTTLSSSMLSKTGTRILIKILDRTEEWASSEGSEEEVFGIAYRLFERLISENLSGSIYDKFSMSEEPVTPHQTSFLKMLDSYCQNSSNNTGAGEYDFLFLPAAFTKLTRYLCKAIQHSLGNAVTDDSPLNNTTTSKDIPSNILRDLDLRLPKVSEAIILTSQCLNSICLEIHTLQSSKRQVEAGYQEVFNAVLAPDFVEHMIDVLRWVDHFLPRIVFGKAAGAPGTKEPPPDASKDTKGFSYLKRDLVRLLGTISHERKEIQDRVRICGGIEVVMNLCVIDERNPYLQEHALFTLRNLLDKNLENQAVVEALKPVGGEP